MKYGVLILAAGASTRLGTSKQSLMIGDQSLLQKTIATALSTEPFNCTVVLGADYDLHRKEINHLPVNIVENPDWKKGMGSSIKKGIHFLIKNPVDAFFILVCDQPLLTSNHLKKLASRYEKENASIVASGYNNTMGVPAIFDWSMYTELLKIPDTGGAKGILMENCKTIVDFEGGEVDLDTRENVVMFLKTYKGK